jgi:RNA polymerase-interacting CarD/CdnL/TRCF family regulator
MTIDGCQHEVLSIYFYTQKFTMHLPKAKLSACRARALSSLDEVAEAFAILKTKKSSTSRNWRNFVIDYHQQMNSGEFKKLAQIIKDTLPNATKTRGAHLCRIDMHNTAIALLANELMFIQNITNPQALEKIQKAVNLSSLTQK